MATRLQLRKGTTAEHSTFVGANGEVTVDTTKKALVLHDGVTAGGKPLPTLDTTGKVPVAQLPDSTTSTKGIVQLATSIEVNTATDSTKAVTPSTLLFGVKSHLNATDNAPMYACRAWVNFNGSTNAIRASGNVSSITDTGWGAWNVNLSNGMKDANYVTSANNSREGSSGAAQVNVVSQSTTTIGLAATYGGDNTIDSFEPSIVDVAVFR